MGRGNAVAYAKHRRNRAKRYGHFYEREAPQPGQPVAYGTRRYRESVRYDRDLEHRAVEAFADGELPEWFIQLRPATHDEDLSGVDLWMQTTSGWVAVQVKSSAARAALFRERHPGMEVATVVLHMSMSLELVRSRVIEAVERVLWTKRRRAA